MFFASFLWACSGNSIPDEIELGEEPRLLVVGFCTCLEKEEVDLGCLDEYRKRFKEEVLELHSDDRKKYIKDVAHSLLESKCLKEQIKDAAWREMIQELEELADE